MRGNHRAAWMFATERSATAGCQGRSANGDQKCASIERGFCPTWDAEKLEAVKSHSNQEYGECGAERVEATDVNRRGSEKASGERWEEVACTNTGTSRADATECKEPT